MKLIIYAVIQSLLLCGGQVFLKFALMRMPAFGWNRAFFASVITNWQLAAGGILFGAASLWWMLIVKRFPFSMAYPMVSISYVMGMFAAILFFHEQVPFIRWVGVFLILTGCTLIAK